MLSYDVAIIGGGLVGASMARSLAGSGLQTVVIDQQASADLYKPSLDNRGLALAYSTKKILENLQVWSALDDYAYPISTVHVSEQGCFGFSRLQALSHKLPALGYVVSASKLGSSLLCGLEELTDITVLRPVKIRGLCFNADNSDWSLVLTQQKIKAKLLIAADGTDSFLRIRQDIACKNIDYNQSAIVTNIHLAHKQLKSLEIAFERFTKNGVLALLPFGSQRYKCIFTVNNENLADFMNLTDTEFLHYVQQVVGFRLGEFNSVDKRLSFPIRHLQTNSLYTESAVLIGNAANTLHPVAAQGFNLGLRDVVELSRLLREAYNDKIAVNSPQILQEYARRRKLDHADTQANTHTLVNLFASNKKIDKAKRRLAILAAQMLTGVNHAIAAKGAGIWTS